MNIFKRSLVAAFATGIVLTGANAGAVAIAQENAVQQDAPKANPALINKDANASLTIHKRATPETQREPGNGLENTSDLGPGLEGAEFQIYKVKGIDLTTNEGWKKATQLKAADIDIKKDVDLVKTVTTGPNGDVTEELALGLYYVVETKAPAGHNIDTAPFLVALPMTHPTELNTWNYNVHVYPKNRKVENPEEPTKTVDDANIKVGDTITYTGTAPVQKYQTLTQFKISDIYDATRITPVGNGVVAVRIVGTRQGQEAHELLNSTDYQVVPGDGQLDTYLTESGIKKLNEFEALTDRKVEVDLKFTVNELIAQDKDAAAILNRLGVIQKNTGTPGENPPDKPTPPENPQWPRSYYGNVEITKKGTGADGEKLLEGVTFDVYRCDSPSSLDTKPLITGVTTNAQGIARISGLQANNWVNNKEWPLDNKDTAGDPRAFIAYCLVETKTAPGHELLAEPVQFQIKADDANRTVRLTALEVKNNPHNGGFNLPLTGGQGVLFLLAGGVLLLVMAGGATFMLRRREA